MLGHPVHGSLLLRDGRVTDVEHSIGTGGRGQTGCRGQDALCGGQSLQQSAGPTRIELGENVVEQQDRLSHSAVANERVGCEAEGESQRALLTLRRVSPGRYAPDFEYHVVTVRPDGGDSTLQVFSASTVVA